ncbi:tape measure protein [Metaclostridioides mangenotii]|uniref:Tape measure domain-containing protein n=1 Tax=Metaclostridioides mangenotii TaxID=1540 RepID=A0ABS4E9R2_9FIRM|nr:tape measure protein [Clostridioides mangenotii]MBP1854648.1 tape measure domain-containing protein [Clostridioides mangenotii]
MATIQSSIGLTDQMSPILQGITNTLNMTISAMEQLGRESEISFNTDGFASARAELNQAEIAMSQIGSSINNNTTGQSNFNEEIREGNSLAGNMLGSLKSMLGVYMGFQGIKITLGIADEFSSITARLGNIKDSLHTTNSFTQEVADSAMRARGSFSSMAQTISRIGYTAKGLFSSDELIQFTENVQKGFVITGATADEASNAMLQLSQAMASGRMQGDELNSTLENNSAVSKALADHLGVSIGQLKELGADGEITSEIIKEAILNATDEINRDFEKMPLTFGQAMENIKTQAQLAFAPVLWVVQQIGVGVASAASGIISVFSEISPVVYGVATVAAAGFGTWATAMLIAKIASLDLGRTLYSLNVQMVLGQVAAQGFAGSLISAFMAVLGPVILLGLAITSAVGYLTNLGMTLTQVFEYAVGIIGSVIAILGFLVVAFSLVQLAINAVSIATLIWSAIVSTNPIVFLIMAIIAGLAVVIAALYQTGVTTGQVLGFMGGMFSMLYTLIKNILKNLWNGFASIAEFFMNVWRHPIVSVAGLFVHMVSGILDNLSSLGSGLDQVGTWIAQAFVWGANKAIGAINWIIDALNKIPGIDIGKKDLLADPGKMTGAGDALRKASRDAESEFADWANEKTGGEYIFTKKFEMEDLGDSFNKGYDWGSKLDLGNLLVNPFGDNVFGDKSNDKVDNWGSGLDSNPLKGGSDAEKRTADATEKMAKSMEASKDDLKYLRDIAEQEAISRYTSPVITINLEASYNGQNVDNDVDGYHQSLADTIIDRLNSSYVGV